MPFSQLGLSNPIVNAIADLDYRQPTDIQKRAIPVILSGKDLIAAAQTGTGKTASFVLPLLEKLHASENDTERNLRGKRIRVLIVTPTRELAVQVEATLDLGHRYSGSNSWATTRYGSSESGLF